jgi:hypothetical protein
VSAASALSPRLGTSIRHIQDYVSVLFTIGWWPLGRVAKKAATNSIEQPHKERASVCLSVFPSWLALAFLNIVSSENCGDMLQCLFGETPEESSSGYLNQSVETEREFV